MCWPLNQRDGFIKHTFISLTQVGTLSSNFTTRVQLWGALSTTSVIGKPSWWEKPITESSNEICAISYVDVLPQTVTLSLDIGIWFMFVTHRLRLHKNRMKFDKIRFYITRVITETLFVICSNLTSICDLDLIHRNLLYMRDIPSS